MMKKLNRLILCSVLIGVHTTAMPASQSQKLSTVNQQLKKLNHHQSKAIHQKQQLITELKEIDLKLSQNKQKQVSLKKKIKSKQNAINHLNKNLSSLDHKLKSQKVLLRKYLTLQYQLGQTQPLALLLNQREPALTLRLVTYLGYINKAQIESLKMFVELTVQIKQQKQIEVGAINNIKQLEKEQIKVHAQYQSDLNLQKEIIQKLNTQIKGRYTKIKQLKRNKKRLENVIKAIKIKTIAEQRKIPFNSQKSKLPWPAIGQIKTKGKDNSDQLNNGIYIIAPEGRMVQAVHSGKVVFADWLRGYGFLLIIQHDHGFMTLYANNQALYKQKGDIVSQGEKISTIGHSGGQLENGLYFEIRRNGNPLPPLRWLRRS